MPVVKITEEKLKELGMLANWQLTELGFDPESITAAVLGTDPVICFEVWLTDLTKVPKLVVSFWSAERAFKRAQHMNSQYPDCSYEVIVANGMEEPPNQLPRKRTDVK